jgi:RNA polymerase sigma-70 factor, ECF subfamily
MEAMRTPTDVLLAFDRLQPELRAVLVEVYFRKRTVAEAAQSLGVPRETVKARIYHAMRALRLALDE